MSDDFDDDDAGADEPLRARPREARERGGAERLARFVLRLFLFIALVGGATFTGIKLAMMFPQSPPPGRPGADAGPIPAVSPFIVFSLSLTSGLWTVYPRFGRQLVSTAFLLGLSLLPLSALLAAMPAAVPEESVFSDSVPRRRGLKLALWRLFGVLCGAAVTVTLLAVSIVIVDSLPVPKTASFEMISRGLVGESVANRLPTSLIKQWPFVLVTMYVLDALAVLMLGKIPLSYNFRNLRVRWPVTLMTASAFTVVLAVLTALLGFVNGMNQMTESSGIPGNVFVLSDGANDESFSSLAYGDIKNLVNERADRDKNGRALPRDIQIARREFGDEIKPMVSYETYFVISRTKPIAGTTKSVRRMVQCRGVEDSEVAQAVHQIKLKAGDWWTAGSIDGVYEVVIGEGIAATLGADDGKGPLGVGDTFDLFDAPFRVVGVMDAEGSTFGSEVWGNRKTLGQKFGKESFSSVVLRVDDETAESASKFAEYLRTYFKSPKLNARSETEYYSELNKTNKQFLIAILAVAAVMGIGGIFGVMNTMFAAIAQRSKDIGVMRILGFKRWQILVSFMVETLIIALLGGMLGTAIGFLADGASATSVLSGGNGPGGKLVVLRITVDAEVLTASLLFTAVMGRMGGIVPAINGMRMGILDSLK